MQQVEVDEFPDSAREFSFQKLHLPAGGAGGLGEKEKAERREMRGKKLLIQQSFIPLLTMLENPSALALEFSSLCILF